MIGLRESAQLDNTIRPKWNSEIADHITPRYAAPVLPHGNLASHFE